MNVQWWGRIILCSILTGPITGALTGAPGHSGSPDNSDLLTVQFGSASTSLAVMSVLAMPNATVDLSARLENRTGEYELSAPNHDVTALRTGQWRVRVPSTPGLYPLEVTERASETSIRLQVFVLDPWDHEGRSLNGYRVGKYEQTALGGRDRYEPPTGFIRVTDANRDVRVSPHFRLDQFLCKQTDQTPQYALVQPRLLRTLEKILAALNDRGFQLSSLHVMSGYRTPNYNRAIGNTTEYSRHLYGDAADIFVDADGDGWMDDITGDGRVSRADARYLARVVRSIPTEGEDSFIGGLGVYGPAKHRGPFVHVDLRGKQARW